MPINSESDAHRYGCGFKRRETSKGYDRSNTETSPSKIHCILSITALSQAKSKGGGKVYALPSALSHLWQRGDSDAGPAYRKNNIMHAWPRTEYASNKKRELKQKLRIPAFAVSAAMTTVFCGVTPRLISRQGPWANYAARWPIARPLCGSPHFTADRAADGFRKSFLPPPMASKAFLGAGPAGIGAPGIMFFGLLMLGRTGVCSMPGW